MTACRASLDLSLRSAARFAAVLLVAAAPAAAQTTAAEPRESGPLAECDARWARRAEGSRGGRARPEEIDEAIAACKEAARSDASSLPARWRLMRAIFFKGEYTTADVEEKKRVFADGKTVGEEALAIVRREASAKSGRRMDSAGPVELAATMKGDRDVVAAFLWAAVDWGKWALAFGKSQAVKQGAAAKIRDYAEAVIAMDPAYDDGAGYRVLGRLHHQTPSVPFFTGWASRKEALLNLRRAMDTAPKHFVNRLYLADAMWDYDKDRRAEARAMLEALVKDTPSAEYVVEDRSAQEEARQLLDTWKQ